MFVQHCSSTKWRNSADTALWLLQSIIGVINIWSVKLLTCEKFWLYGDEVTGEHWNVKHRRDDVNRARPVLSQALCHRTRLAQIVVHKTLLFWKGKEQYHAISGHCLFQFGREWMHYQVWIEITHAQYEFYVIKL